MRRSAMLWFVFLLSLSARAQILNIGNDVTGDEKVLGADVVRTHIDLANPATATGTISAIKVYWSATPCPSAFKIKFFRRAGIGTTLKMTEERGPFSTVSGGAPTLSLAPAVGVLQGDLIGIARLSDCGTAAALFATPSDGFLTYTGDVTGAVDVADAAHSGGMLQLFGSGSATESIRGVIAVAGSTAGAHGANFKTSLQLLNPSSAGTLTGRLDFHAAGAGSERSGSLLYSLGPRQTVTHADVVAAMGQQGLGSIDLVVTAGQDAPLAVTWIYNDAGSEGTSGLSQEVVDPELLLKGVAHMLTRGASGYLITPVDPAQTRFNIGIRTMCRGAAVRATLRDGSGSALATVTKSYLPNWFEQLDAPSFLGAPISGSQSIEIAVTAGSAIVYGSTTDNTTNDPAIQFVHVIFSGG